MILSVKIDRPQKRKGGDLHVVLPRPSLVNKQASKGLGVRYGPAEIGKRSYVEALMYFVESYELNNFGTLKKLVTVKFKVIRG